MASSDWNPAHYGQFADLRLRPAIDLLGRVGDLPPGDIVDLGCGSGAAGPVLRSRFDGRRIVGIDRSPAMLAKAAALGCYDALSEQDVAAWQPDSPPALIFSNATLHWLGDHETLLPRLAEAPIPGRAPRPLQHQEMPAPPDRAARGARARRAGGGARRGRSVRMALFRRGHYRHRHHGSGSVQPDAEGLDDGCC